VCRLILLVFFRELRRTSQGGHSMSQRSSHVGVQGSFFVADQRDCTGEEIVNTTDHLDLAISNSRRHDGLQPS